MVFMRLRMALDEEADQAIYETWARLAPVVQDACAEYRFVDGFLIESGDVVTVYAALGHPEIPGELAKVRSTSDAESFARRYGLLGFVDADRTPPVGLDEALIAFKEPSVAADTWQHLVRERQELRRAPGDPMDWFLAHAATVSVILELSHLLQTGGDAGLSRYLGQYRARRANGDEAIVLRVAIAGDFPPGLMEFPVNVGVDGRIENATTLGRRIVAELLNANMRRTRRYVDRETLRPYFGLQTLADCIYWLLANEVSGGRLRQCKSCSGIFTATDDRMRYCPPPMGLTGASRCMNRAKQRKLRAKRAQAQRKREKKTRGLRE
jgi:hypothetical protein